MTNIAIAIYLDVDLFCLYSHNISNDISKKNGVKTYPAFADNCIASFSIFINFNNKSLARDGHHLIVEC